MLYVILTLLVFLLAETRLLRPIQELILMCWVLISLLIVLPLSYAHAQPVSGQ